MKTAIGLALLVLFTVLEKATGFPEQERDLEYEDQDQDKDEDDVEDLSRSGDPCHALNGKCLRNGRSCPKDKPLDIRGGKYCGGKLKCCHQDSRQVCACNINKGKGCTLGAPPIPGHACRCELTGPLTNPNTQCRGYVVDCNDPASPACQNPTTGYDSCSQGRFGNEGNCCGYKEAYCSPGPTNPSLSYLDTNLTKMRESDVFAIQHIETGMWLRAGTFENGAKISIWPNLDASCRFKAFQRNDTRLVQILHMFSGKFLHPYGGSYSPPENTPISIDSGHPFYTFYKFDQFNNTISHQNGRIFAPDLNINQPGTWIRLFNPEDDRQKHFRVVDYNDPSQEFLIYGNADVTAYWRLVFCLNSPAIATQTYTEKVQVGYSKTESSESTFTFAWQISAKKQFLFAKMSMSVSIAYEVTQSSSETWTSSTEQTVQFTVEKGQTVAVWQRHFSASQLDHISVQQSNQYYQTKDCNTKPPEGDDAFTGSFWA